MKHLCFQSPCTHDESDEQIGGGNSARVVDYSDETVKYENEMKKKSRTPAMQRRTTANGRKRGRQNTTKKKLVTEGTRGVKK